MPKRPALKPKASKRIAKKMLLGIFFLITTTFIFLEIMIGTKSPAPNSQNISSSKENKLFHPIGKLTGLSHTKKLSQPISVKIEGDGQASGANKSFLLKGIVEVQQPIATAELKWSLPEGVRVLSGSLSETLVDLNPSSPRVVEITLESDSSDNRQIHLIVESRTGEIQFSKVAQFNTTRQKQIDQSKEKLIERSKSFK